MSAMRSTLHRLRGFVASLEDGMGVNGVVQQPWIDEAYRLVDAALAEMEAMERRAELTERVVEAARRARRILDEWVLASDDGPEIVTRAEAVMDAALAELDGQTLDTSYYQRRRERRMTDPEYAAEAERVCPCRVHGDPDGDCNYDRSSDDPDTRDSGDPGLRGHVPDRAPQTPQTGVPSPAPDRPRVRDERDHAYGRGGHRSDTPGGRLVRALAAEPHGGSVGLESGPSKLRTEVARPGAECCGDPDGDCGENCG